VVEIIRTSSENQDFIDLVILLDAELAERDGDDHTFYNQFNSIDGIKHAIILYENDTPMGCGGIKEFEPGSMEVKRMYTKPVSRGKGFASKILMELEFWATEMSYEKCVLETGKRQPEAIALYAKNGYKVMRNYGQYAGIENSICFEKALD
jgi:GNAT superfamily N-acetyltransferase